MNPMETSAAKLVKEAINNHADGALSTYQLYDLFLKLLEIQFQHGANHALERVVEETMNRDVA